MWDLEKSFTILKHKDIDNKSIPIYLEVIKNIEKESDSLNKNNPNFTENYKVIILRKLLSKRREILKSSINKNKEIIESEIENYKQLKKISEETFSMFNISGKIGYNESFKEFLIEFLDENKSLEPVIIDHIKLEIIDEVVYNINKELKQ